MSFRMSQVAILGILTACAVYAQTSTATLSGVVRDPQGGGIPGTAISAVQIDTGQTRQTTSGGTGDYAIPNLPIGNYRITASASGFKKVLIPSIELQVNQEARVDLTLEVGAVSDEVTVTAQAPLLETESASVGQVVENRSIEGIALNGRQFWQLVSLTPGASYTPGNDRTRTGGSSIRSSAVNVQINGTGFIYNGWLLDGTDITEYEQGGTNVQPNVDALQEFKVLSANMPAEYGHTPNFVSATMKSGTNEFHGTLFEFLRNDKVDARNFFAATKNALRRNQYGGTVGGPVKKNKVFFFADMEQTNQRRGTGVQRHASHCRHANGQLRRPEDHPRPADRSRIPGQYHSVEPHRPAGELLPRLTCPRKARASSTHRKVSTSPRATSRWMRRSARRTT